MDTTQIGMLLQVIGFGLAVLLASTFLNPEVIGAWIHRLNSKYINISLKLAHGILRIAHKNFSTETEPEHSILKAGVTSGVTPDHPSKKRFTVVIWGQNRGNFPQPPESYYAGKSICVTGLIQEYEGIPQIEVTTPDDIQEQ